jgi:hypothetical protein
MGVRFDGEGDEHEFRTVAQHRAGNGHPRSSGIFRSRGDSFAAAIVGRNRSDNASLYVKQIMYRNVQLARSP